MGAVAARRGRSRPTPAPPARSNETARREAERAAKTVGCESRPSGLAGLILVDIRRADAIGDRDARRRSRRARRSSVGCASEPQPPRPGRGWRGVLRALAPRGSPAGRAARRGRGGGLLRRSVELAGQPLAQGSHPDRAYLHAAPCGQHGGHARNLSPAPRRDSTGGTLDTVVVRASGVRQQSIWASVVSDNAAALRRWLLALGFTEDLLIPGGDDGAIHHCQLDWPEGGRIMLSSSGERPTPCRPGTSSLHVVTAHPDAVMVRARALNASVVHELADQTDYPSRDFTVADPDGNHWTFATFAG